ncbi:peptidyl-prolyl cis-trans isomerase FKBP53-like [Nymphaea colorata]|nr:peptidyl-prolyl cis-trans isomerase FKBP53-like [Nymphaea colorata]
MVPYGINIWAILQVASEQIQVKSEDSIDDEQPGKVNDGSKLPKRQPCPAAERKFLTLEDSSEDEDGLPISTGRRKIHSKVVETNENLDRQLREENVGEKPADDEKCHSAGSKRKSDAFALDKNQNKSVSNTLNLQKDSSEKGLENSRKSKKKKEKGMMKQGPGSGPVMPIYNASNDACNSQDQSGLEHGAEDVENGNTAVPKSAANRSVLEVEEVKKQKNKTKKKNTAETDQNIDTDQSKVASSGNKRELEEVAFLEDHAEGPPMKGARTFPNGMIMEAISMGKPNGKRASPE